MGNISGHGTLTTAPEDGYFLEPSSQFILTFTNGFPNSSSVVAGDLGGIVSREDFPII